MNIRLTPDLERIIEEELKEGHFRTAEEVIGEALRALREKAHSSSTPGATNGQREAVQAMLAFVEKHHVRLHGVSIRQLIHEGHRL
ncbi:MAG TPA: hypothetical protein VGA40_02590 [Candidatus Acidoferrales bacterium]